MRNQPMAAAVTLLSMATLLSGGLSAQTESKKTVPESASRIVTVDITGMT